MDTRELVQLSPTSLNLFKECKLCFWLNRVKGVERPEGPDSTLPRGMDLLIKKYFDEYRARKELPPELVGKVEGELLSDQQLIDSWRNRWEGLYYEDKKLNAVFRGLLDECFFHNGFYIPVDYKTRGFDLKEDSLSYYQTQLDCYTFLLGANGYKHPFFGYLIYYIPEEVRENGKVRFRIEPKKLNTNPSAAYKLFKKAVSLLRSPQPASHSDCEFCSLGRQLFKS